MSRRNDPEDSITRRTVETVRRFPIIYDIKHPDYKNVEKKKEAWVEIAMELHLRVNQVKRRWKRLAKRYAKYKQAQVYTTATPKYKNYNWHTILSFLDPLTPLRRPSRKNWGRQRLTDNVAKETEKDEEMTSDESCPSDDEEGVDAEMPFTSKSNQSKRRNGDGNYTSRASRPGRKGR